MNKFERNQFGRLKENVVRFSRKMMTFSNLSQSYHEHSKSLEQI